MPQSNFPGAELTCFFALGKFKNYWMNLDPYGGAGPDGIFIFFFSS